MREGAVEAGCGVKTKLPNANTNTLFAKTHKSFVLCLNASRCGAEMRGGGGRFSMPLRTRSVAAADFAVAASPSGAAAAESEMVTQEEENKIQISKG